jgi:hypothetical protein
MAEQHFEKLDKAEKLYNEGIIKLKYHPHNKFGEHYLCTSSHCSRD